MRLIRKLETTPIDATQKSIAKRVALTSEERSRSRHPFETEDGTAIYLHLPRGTALRDGDWLQAETGDFVQVIAKAEPVYTVTAQTTLELLQAAYHLGNRHVPLEITESYVRLSPDPVLRQMLEQRGLSVTESCMPFQPESGAYGAGTHGHAH